MTKESIAQFICDNTCGVDPSWAYIALQYFLATLSFFVAGIALFAMIMILLVAISCIKKRH